MSLSSNKDINRRILYTSQPPAVKTCLFFFLLLLHNKFLLICGGGEGGAGGGKGFETSVNNKQNYLNAN